MSENSRVVIAGLGLVAPGARSPAAFWDLLGTEEVTRPAIFGTGVALDNELAYLAGDTGAEASSRAERLALSAVGSALDDAALAPAALGAAGVYFGSGMGAIDGFNPHDSGRQHYEVSASIARAYGCLGPNQVFSTACASSLYAVGLAAELIRTGEVDLMIVGGVEICFQIGYAAFNRLKCLDSQYCRPFDLDREGTVFGEGAAALVLESEAHWRRRGAAGHYGEVAGFGWSCDGFHVTAPEPSGRAIGKAMAEALQRAGVSADDVDCIIPHGTGTRLNDEVEAGALARLLGKRLGSVPLLPLKARIGHTGGAAGAFSCLAGALVGRHQEVPPTANVTYPEYGLHIPRRRVERPVRYILVNAYAFGGNNASIVIGSGHAF